MTGVRGQQVIKLLVEKKLSCWNTFCFTFWTWKDYLSCQLFSLWLKKRTSWAVLRLVQYLNQFNYCDELHVCHWSPCSYLPQSTNRLFILPFKSTKFEAGFCLLMLITNHKNQNELYTTNWLVCFTVLHGNADKLFWQHANQAAISKRGLPSKKTKGAGKLQLLARKDSSRLGTRSCL